MAVLYGRPTDSLPEGDFFLSVGTTGPQRLQSQVVWSAELDTLIT
jgi:hypothetical protein